MKRASVFVENKVVTVAECQLYTANLLALIIVKYPGIDISVPGKEKTFFDTLMFDGSDAIIWYSYPMPGKNKGDGLTSGLFRMPHKNPAITSFYTTIEMLKDIDREKERLMDILDDLRALKKMVECAPVGKGEVCQKYAR